LINAGAALLFLVDPNDRLPGAHPHHAMLDQNQPL
jgi:hypothetical protein